MQKQLFRCTNCNSQIDNNLHKPISACQHLICLSCSQTSDPQYPNEIYCDQCKINVNFNRNNPSISHQVLELVQNMENNQPVSIYCQNHKQKKIKYFCNYHKELLCSQCFLLTHVDHNQMVMKFTAKEIQNHANMLQAELDELKNEIVENQANLLQIQKLEKSLGSQQIIEFFRKSEAFLTDLLFKNKAKNYEKKFICAPKQILNFESKILQDEKYFNFINDELINHQKLSLLYRGSRDGFSAINFHDKCDGKANSITFIKATDGMIVGGYTSIAWSSNNGQQVDDKAFLFSVDHQQKFGVVNSAGAIYNHSSFGPTFGGNLDLHVSINKNKNHLNNNYIYIAGQYYQKPTGSASHLAIRTNFTVQEIEVFQLI